MKVDKNKQPLISIDVVPVRFDKTAGALEIGTGRRLFDPFVGEQALPGVLLMQGESIEHAAYRALNSKTGILAEHSGYITQLGAFDGTNRDPRGATISIALLSAQEFDRSPSTRVLWTPVADAAGLPFDHDTIVRGALSRISQSLWVDAEMMKMLLGKQFSTSDAIELSKAVGAWPTDASNFGRWLSSNRSVKKLDKPSTSTGRGRPSAVWTWA